MKSEFLRLSSNVFISHPNIIAYKESFFEDSTNSLCIVMEYADDGDLSQKIEKHKQNGTFINELEVWRIFINSLKGLKALHELNIFHRDMKVN